MKRFISLGLSFLIIISTLTACTEDARGFSKNDLIYFIMTDRFYDGNTENNLDVDKDDPKKRHGGDLRGIIEKLDYIETLGTTAIWITPVMQNEKDGYHGYWIEDFEKVDEHLGTMDDMKELVKKSHEKEIKVILDYVVNHTGYNSPWLDDPEKKDWFNDNKTITNWNDQKQVEDGWLMGLPDLNLNNPEVKDYFIENALWWIDETGIDGMRLDTVKHVPKEFWIDFTAKIKEKHPDFYFLGEVWSENPTYLKPYIETGIDGMTNYPLYKGIITTFFEYGNTKHLVNAVEDDEKFENKELNGIFIDNHDNPRFISKQKTNGEDYLKQALTFIMTYPAIPVIYYGTEIGMEGLEDPDNRHDMDWERTKDSHMLDFYKELVKLRESKSMMDGNFKLVDSDPGFLAYQIDSDKDHNLVIINIKDKEKDITINQKGMNKKLKSQLDDREFEAEDDQFKIKLKPLDILILKDIK